MSEVIRLQARRRLVLDDTDVIPLPGATSARFFIPKKPNKRSLTEAEKASYDQVLNRLFMIARGHSPERAVRLKLLAEISLALHVASPDSIKSYEQIFPGLRPPARRRRPAALHPAEEPRPPAGAPGPADHPRASAHHRRHAIGRSDLPDDAGGRDLFGRVLRQPVPRMVPRGGAAALLGPRASEGRCESPRRAGVLRTGDHGDHRPPDDEGGRSLHPRGASAGHGGERVWPPVGSDVRQRKVPLRTAIREWDENAG